MNTKAAAWTFLATLTPAILTAAISRPARASSGDDEAPGQHVARPAPPPAPQQPAVPAAPTTTTAVRATAMVDLFSGGAYGLEVSHRLGPILGLDATFGRNDMTYGHTGVFAEALARLYAFKGAGGISFAAGPSLRTANEFGAIGFLRAEVAAELRWPGVPDLLVGFGPEVALNDSGRATCPGNGWFSCFFWQDQWHAGDVGYRGRVAAGWTF
jgi:hypothetical protein